jgi:hypothetical protein
MAPHTRSGFKVDGGVAAIAALVVAGGAAVAAMLRWFDRRPKYGEGVGTDDEQEDAALVADPLTKRSMVKIDRTIEGARSRGEDVGTALRRAGYRPLADVMDELAKRAE